LLVAVVIVSRFTPSSAPVLAQVQIAPGPGQPNEGRIISGPDLGFQVAGTTDGGRVTGQFMVRINGKWIPVGEAAGPRRLTMK
jgi:hypothetical protein